MAKSFIKKWLAKWLFFVLIYEGTFLKQSFRVKFDPKLLSVQREYQFTQ